MFELEKILVPLLKDLRSDLPLVRKKAADSLSGLSRYGTRRVTGYLISALYAESDDTVRVSLILALGKYGGASAIECIKGFLSHRNPDVADGSRLALEDLGVEEEKSE